MANILMEALRALRKGRELEEDVWDIDDLDYDEQVDYFEGEARKAAIREYKAEEVAAKILSTTSYEEQSSDNLKYLLELSNYYWHDPHDALNYYKKMDRALIKQYPELVSWTSLNEDDFGNDYDEDGNDIWTIVVTLKDWTQKTVKATESSNGRWSIVETKD